MALELNLNSITGLSEEEASLRIAKDGFNELSSSKKRSILAIALSVLSEPMFILLVSCGTIYLFLGDVNEALMLLGFVLVIMGITISQERKTERALEALKDMSSPRALVIRGSIQKRIPGREVVSGDTVILTEGDRIPADAYLISCVNLEVDESLLTGESVAVRKTSAEGNDQSKVYSGTLVVSGMAIAKVTATGTNTELGKIGKMLERIEDEKTSLEKETSKIVKNLAVAGIFLCALVVVLYGISRHDWLHGFLAGIALAMATLPEEFPVILTVFLALGAWRMSQKNVLARKVKAVESLGSATVLCVDKTGTITTNRMSVCRLEVKGSYFDARSFEGHTLPENFHELVEFAMLAGRENPFDPMEMAVKRLAEKTLQHTEHIHKNWTLIQEYPLDSKLLAMTRVWKSPDGQKYVIAAKGSPEAMIDLCHLGAEESKKQLEIVAKMASEGHRVLGVAKSEFEHKSLPAGQHDFEFKFLGFLSLEDPVREGVPEAVNECYRAGIKVAMITGDYPKTAINIAKQIGLANADICLTGKEIDELNDNELKEKIQSVNVFARVVPEQKLRIVNAFKSAGHIVAMTGDGVNDSPALKAAHIGIAMGERGTDVARESADLVLVDDDFSSIVSAVKMGRRVYTNIRKAMSYVLAVHLPIAGISLLPVLFNLPLVLFPAHIVFLELIIDPSCSIVFEAEPDEKDSMRKPPRKISESIFTKKTVIFSALEGLGILAVISFVFFLARNQGASEINARAATFTTLIFCNLGLILSNRSLTRSIISTYKAKNVALWAVLAGSLFFLALVLYLPVLRSIFGFGVLVSGDFIVCALGGIAAVFWCEILKVFRKKLEPAV